VTFEAAVREIEPLAVDGVAGRRRIIARDETTMPPAAKAPTIMATARFSAGASSFGSLIGPSKTLGSAA
jgi:hypothetical protein